MIKWFGAVLAGLLIVGAVAVIGGGYFDEDTVTTTVNSKERVCDSNSEGGMDCQYLVFTDAGTFKITDAIFGTQRFNSSDLYGKVKECHNYEITSYGWRIPIMSSYPNIKSMDDLGRDDGCTV